MNGIYGRHRTRLFEHKGILYGSMESDYDFEIPEEFEEIKASEFYKVIEEDSKSSEEVNND